MTKASFKYNHFQPRRSETATSGPVSRLLYQENIGFNNRRSLLSSTSTPLPERIAPVNTGVHAKLFFDQGTQTDPTSDTSMDKIDKLESVLRRLYTQFITLVTDLQINEEQSLTLERMSIRSDHNTDDVREESATERQNTPSVEFNADSKNANGLQVRRASAQTTNIGLPIAENIQDDMVCKLPRFFYDCYLPFTQP